MFFYSDDPAKDWDRYCDALERQERKTADEFLQEALDSTEKSAEWITEYLIGGFYPANEMARLKSEDRWTASKQAAHIRAATFVEAVAELIATRPELLTGAALAAATTAAAAFRERAEQMADDQ